MLPRLWGSKLCFPHLRSVSGEACVSGLFSASLSFLFFFSLALVHITGVTFLLYFANE